MATATAMAHSSFSGGEDALPPLHFAALNSSTGAVDALLTGGAPAGSVAPASGLPPLHYAVSNPDAGVLRALLAAGAPVDGGPGPAAARGGLTPLLLAAWLGNYTAVVDLLTAGASRRWPHSPTNRPHVCCAVSPCWEACAVQPRVLLKRPWPER